MDLIGGLFVPRDLGYHGQKDLVVGYRIGRFCCSIVFHFFLCWSSAPTLISIYADCPPWASRVTRFPWKIPALPNLVISLASSEYYMGYLVTLLGTFSGLLEFLYLPRLDIRTGIKSTLPDMIDSGLRLLTSHEYIRARDARSQYRGANVACIVDKTGAA